MMKLLIVYCAYLVFYEKFNYITIHISSGLSALKAAKKVSGKTKIVGVTILTSHDNKSLKEIGYNKKVQQIVLQQAKLANKAKLDAIVCSPQEVSIVKKVFKKEIITPGIRFNSNKNDQKIFKQIVSGLVKGAKKSSMPIVGGETAIMSDLIAGKGFGFDLAGMVVGMLSKKEMVLGNKIKPNDVIIGIKSSGLHSNGYSLARKALLTKYSVKDNIKGIGNLGNALLRPTEIYVKPVLEAVKKCKINGLAHITGGSFTKLLRLKQIGYNVSHIF